MKESGYCDVSEVGALGRALSGTDATSCATLEIVGLSQLFAESSHMQETPNSLAIWRTPLFSSKHSTTNLS